MNWLQTQAQQNPQKLFIQDGCRSFTFMDVEGMVQIYSQSLIREGIQPQDRIIIHLPCGIEMAEIILACFEIGAIATPISRRLTDIEKREVISIIQPRLIITNWNDQEQYSDIFSTLICIEELPNSSGKCSLLNNKYQQSPNDVSAIIFTSGTTGIPKAVQLTYSNFETSCKNWDGFLQFEPNDQFLCCLPLHHIGGLAVLIRALIYGFSVNLINTFKAKVIHEVISNYPITMISLVPTMLKRILAIKGGLVSLKSLRYILLGGGPSPGYLLDFCIQEKLHIIKVYGMTETCSGTFVLNLLDEPQYKSFAGRPFPGVKTWTQNDEIHISGPMVMKGYWGEKESKGIHNSHDFGNLEDDNLLFLHIRRKDLIISGGENINPQEVEEHLMKVNGIIDAAVVGKEDEEWGQRVTAYIVQESVTLKNKFLQLELKKYLSPHKIPKEYIRVALIPRNELGKIVYNKLKYL